MFFVQNFRRGEDCGARGSSGSEFSSGKKISVKKNVLPQKT
jgi:hypothetical protein